MRTGSSSSSSEKEEEAVVPLIEISDSLIFFVLRPPGRAERGWDEARELLVRAERLSKLQGEGGVWVWTCAIPRLLAPFTLCEVDA